MLDPALTPTRLVDPKTRPALRIIEPERPSRFRSLTLLLGVARLAVIMMRLKVVARRRPEAAGVQLRQLLESMGGL